MPDSLNLPENEYLSILKESISPMHVNEKWKKDVEIQSTGQHAGKSIAQLKAEIEKLKGKPGNKEKMGELLFALRAKQGWKKSTGLPKD